MSGARENTKAADKDVVIKVRGLVNGFGDKVIHDHLDLDVYRGEVLGVVGGSGTGKSVLLRSIIGLNKFQSGTIEVFGRDTVRTQRRRNAAAGNALGRAVPGRCAVSVPDRGGEHPGAVARIYQHVPGTDERDRVDEAHHGGPARRCGAKYPSELSGGMKKRAGLARALALDPDLVFLDEPTAGLDPISANMFDELVKDLQKSLGLTVFMVTHDLDTLRAITDRIAVLVDKKIKVGTIDELRHDPHPWIQEYFSGPRGRAAA